jgi:glycosyltransferase involved in cell wall biosynthesis
MSKFDAVVMLTWSNWHREPRSNRYHFATRFSRFWPVFFVQPDSLGDAITFERLANFQIEIVHVPANYNIQTATKLEEALRRRGVRRPLLWIYNVFFVDYIYKSFAPLRIYHATEDYCSPTDQLKATAVDIRADVQRVLHYVDAVVVVSEGLVNAYRVHGGFAGEILVLRNGCDSDFWSDTGASEYSPPSNGCPVAFYEGGINSRLDIQLLQALADRMPDWEFWLCGLVQPDLEGWAGYIRRVNVKYHGLLEPYMIADLARHARVGIIPFVQDELMRRSLPLKAYEYVACGLPVVSTPIDALANAPNLFRFAADHEQFERAIRALAPTRTEEAKVAERLAAASAVSYDGTFSQLLDFLNTARPRPARTPSALNVLMLYDDKSTHVTTIEEHLLAFKRHSRHNYHFLPATGCVPGIDDGAHLPDLSAYDAVVIHYCVRVSMDEHLSPAIADLVTGFGGHKILLIQDDYDRPETARRWIERLGIDTLWTVVPANQMHKVYPPERFPHLEIISTLTGFAPDESSLTGFAIPIEDRQIMIGYRGRRLPHHYGRLGYEKYYIGEEMKRRATEVGLRVDIEVDTDNRIYGDAWYRFLGSCRATLGTESGSNVFDDHGELAALASMHDDLSFAEFSRRFLGPYEGQIETNVISPKMLEAVILRTALVMFDGDYSGILKRDQHYIPLNRDFSNVREVFDKISDMTFLKLLTERAYADIIGSGRYSYSAFIAEFDQALERRVPRGARATILSAPVLVRYRSTTDFQRGPAISSVLFDGICDQAVSPREAIIEALRDASLHSNQLELRAETTSVAVEGESANGCAPHVQESEGLGYVERPIIIAAEAVSGEDSAPSTHAIPPATASEAVVPQAPLGEEFESREVGIRSGRLLSKAMRLLWRRLPLSFRLSIISRPSVRRLAEIVMWASRSNLV